MDETSELLRRFADEGAQEAFAELVQRTVNFVYAAALRQPGGNGHLAQDVTQGVYLALAGRAATLKHHAVLTGWLHTTTRFLATKAMRTQARWQRREQEANMITTLAGETEPAWGELRPVIDEALHELGEKDRVALLLRFFEGRSLAEVGSAVGLAENAARMRVERALEKLRARLAARGITSTATALGVVLANQPMVAAPAGFAASVTATSIVGMAATGTVAGGGLIFMSAKLKMAVVGALLAVGVGTWWTMQQRLDAAQTAAAERDAQQTRELAALRRENRLLAEAGRGAVAQLAMATASSESEKTPAPKPAIENLRLITDLIKRGLVRTGLSVVEMEGGIQRPWAEVFGLTPAEQDALTRATLTARQQIGALELTHASARREADGGLVITVEPFSEGGAIYDRLLESYAAVLGPERYASFATLGLKDMEDQLHGLGLGRQTITVTHNRAPVDPKAAWSLTTRLERSDGTVKYGSANDSRPDRLVAFMLGSLVQLVPPDL